MLWGGKLLVETILRQTSHPCTHRGIKLPQQLLDNVVQSRIIGKLEEGRNVTSGAAEFGIAHSIVSRLWRPFQTTGTAIRGFSSGHSRGTATELPVHCLTCQKEQAADSGRNRQTHDTGDGTTDIAFYRGQKTARW
ncbi:hypothetical protein TNCV_2831941 [Trichonephila clavipes]|nr:hypothetical protein TNCV_2831941 [Trichonephila clavipes]